MTCCFIFMVSVQHHIGDLYQGWGTCGSFIHTLRLLLACQAELSYSFVAYRSLNFDMPQPTRFFFILVQVYLGLPVFKLVSQQDDKMSSYGFDCSLQK